MNCACITLDNIILMFFKSIFLEEYRNDDATGIGGQASNQTYLVSHGHNPSHAAVAGVASDVQLGYVEARRYALAVLVAAVPVPCDVTGLAVPLLG